MTTKKNKTNTQTYLREKHPCLKNKNESHPTILPQEIFNCADSLESQQLKASVTLGLMAMERGEVQCVRLV